MTLLRSTRTVPMTCATPSRLAGRPGIPARVIDERWATSAAAAGTLRAGGRIVRAIATPPRRWRPRGRRDPGTVLVVVQVAETILQPDDSAGRVF